MGNIGCHSGDARRRRRVSGYVNNQSPRGYLTFFNTLRADPKRYSHDPPGCSSPSAPPFDSVGCLIVRLTALDVPTLETVHSARSEPMSSRSCSPTTRFSDASNPLRHSKAAKASFQSNCRRRRPVPLTDARPLAASLSSSLPLWRVLARSWDEARSRPIVPDAVRSTSPAAAACRDLGARPRSYALRRRAREGRAA